MNKMKKCLVRCLMMAALCLMVMQTVPAQAKSVNLGDKANLKNENFELKIPELEGIYVESENDGESLDASTAPTLSDSKLLLEICKRFRTAILKGKDSVDISDLKVPVTDKYLEMLGTLKYYCPYLDDFGLSLTNYYYDSSIVKTLYYSNHYSEEDTKKYIADVDEGLNRILSEVKSTDSTLTKCLVVHDYLVSHFEYDTGYSCYNASDHLVYGRGVCQAYAYLYKYILNTLGVTCYTTVSTTHMWNVVTISGKNYIVDATWDDPLYDAFGCSRHEWFLITDTQMMNLDGSINHVENSSLPCTSTTYSNAYFRNIESPVYVDGDYRYYTQNGNLYRYNVSSKKKTVLDTCSDFDGLFLYDGRIYYAQDKKIKTYNISTGKIGTFYTAKKEIVGLRKDGNYAGYVTGEYSWDEYGRPVSDLDYYTVSVTTVNKPSIKSCYNSSTGIKLNWSSIKDVTGYYIYRKTSSTNYTKIATVKTGTTTYTDDLVKDKNGIGYTYKVVAYRGHLTSKYSSKYIYRLKSSPITSLTNSAAGALTVKWTANTKVTGYEIQYSTSSTFSSPKTVTVTGADTLSKKISSLTKGKTYYVRVRGYKTINDTKHYSGWSANKSVKIAS